MYFCYFCDVSYRSFQSYKQHFERKYLCKRSMDMDMPDEKITSAIKCEYVYLLQEREFINSGQSIYKIGRTKQLNDKRFKQYPKNSMLLLQTFCNNCVTCENQIMNMFKQKYIHRVDIGSEYFEGNVKEMQRDIFNIVMSENELTNLCLTK